LYRYRGERVERRLFVAPLNPDGTYTLGRYHMTVLFTYDSKANRLFYLISRFTAPARMAGGAAIVHEPIDQERELRASWVYLQGLRRVKRVSNIGYDTPFGDGLLTTDQVDVFNGDTSWFEWKLMGKQELYVPYNCYKLQDPSTDMGKLLRPKHPD